MRVVSICHAGTLGETPIWVMSATEPSGDPLERAPRLGATTHGWRPISVKIQPKDAAAKGMGMLARASCESRSEPGARPRLVAHSPHAASAKEAAPSPIMRRKDQNTAICGGRKS